MSVTSKRLTQTFFKPRRVHPRRPSRAGRKGKTFTLFRLAGLTAPGPLWVSEDALRMIDYLCDVCV